MSKPKYPYWFYIPSRFSHDAPDGSARSCFDLCMQISESTSQYVCEIVHEDDAKAIVKACNAFDEFLAALKCVVSQSDKTKGTAHVISGQAMKKVIKALAKHE